MKVLQALLKNTYNSIPEVPDETLVIEYKKELINAAYKNQRVPLFKPKVSKQNKRRN